MHLDLWMTSDHTLGLYIQVVSGLWVELCVSGFFILFEEPS